VAKQLFMILAICVFLVETCVAAETHPAVGKEENVPIDFEKQVREVAQRTAAEARAKKEQERLAKAKAASDKITASGGSAIRVFKYKKDGAVMFADSAPYQTQYEVVVYNSCYACSITSSVNWHNTRLHLTEFSDAISLAAKQYRVDVGFIRAIIHAESAFNPLARSRKGAMGLMQLMPGTAKDMGVADTTNPEQNIKGGVKYLASLLQTFSGNEALAAAAYNAGAGAVTRYSGIPPYEETQTYVKRVKILSDRYKNQKQLAAN
jgi:soluble lytic murein transglycosylase-like protein